MPLATAVPLGHGQDRAHITGDGGFRHAKGARQLCSDAIAEALTPEVSGNLSAAQAGVKAPDAVILTPSIRALTDLRPGDRAGPCPLRHFRNLHTLSDSRRDAQRP